MITIDKDWSVVMDDAGYNCILTHTETKTRKKKDTPAETETYQSSTPYYYPTIEDCLTTYMHKSLEPCKSIQEVLSKIAEVHATIKKVKAV